MVGGINVNGNVLTFEGGEEYKESDPDQCVGARYSHSLCPEFPHFEVKIPINVCKLKVFSIILAFKGEVHSKMALFFLPPIES